ncbi:O-succinylbenzoate synthase [Cyclonatronum proteinivorum]|uniref:o-succinylbenzoate synthase n=1 Tax=Cyclonatronum proteinivorum TaxID=1457365 RepID=A0A345UGM1_9BACT|nr:o-succinylbenzoate synthase [Cyclonatronum proteinivorum]AXI99622.1 O-succinylbenzoate synthase [Cyclonatronum proteinivorum]
MKLTACTYKIPFRAPFRTAGHYFAHRTGLLFFLVYDDGSQIVSEAAPLPGFSEETLEDVLRYLSDHPDWYSFLDDAHLPGFETSIPASLQFACSVLWLKHKAKQSQTNIAVLLGAAPSDSLAVNAAIGLGTTEDLIRKTEEAAAQGYRTIKYKISGEGTTLFEALSHLRESQPGLRFRLDANGCWQPDEAASVLRKFEGFGIEYCEQPVSPADDQRLNRLRSLTRIPVAADESARTLADVKRIIKEKLADVLILKPMICGSVGNLLDILKMAESAGLCTVFTTSLDSAIARRDTALLASALCKTDTAHGLSTGALLASDTLTNADPIENGRFLTGSIPLTLNPDLLNFSLLEQVYERAL